MKRYLIRPPKLYRWMYSEAIFRGSADQKKIYLTFDDGPDPEATDHVLSVLDSHGIRATFFLLGNNIKRYPEVVERIKKEGHLIANHGMNHLDGWKSGVLDYVEDVMEGKELTKSNLFRPAYGKLGFRQYLRLKKTERIVFWDVVSGDFDTGIDGPQVIKNVLSNTRNGSIIVMHDSKKAFPNLKTSLDMVIHRLSEKGYSFATLDAFLDNKID